MNEMQIFNNSEFGEVRTVINDDGVWFVANDIGRALGYSDPRIGAKKLVDDDDKLVVPLDSSGQRRMTTIINESGLYALIFGSKLENAKKFKKWVTSEVLPSIRKTGRYSVAEQQLPSTPSEQIRLLAQGHVELEKKVDGVVQDVESVKDEIEEVKNNLPILPIEADEIVKAVKRKGVATLGGKDAAAYKDRGLRQRVYNNLYANLKYNFDIKSYKALKRCQVGKAIGIVESYKPPVFLAEQIEVTNAQIEIAI